SPGGLMRGGRGRWLGGLGGGATLRVEEAEAPAARLRQRQRARELPAAGALREQLDRLAVHHRDRLGQIAVGAGGDVRLGAARRAQVSRGPFLGASRQSGILWVQVGDG